MNTMNERGIKAAQVAGVETARMRQVRLDIGKMLDAGLLIDVDLHGFSALKASVSWAELGIADDDERRQRMGTGVKFLAPAQYVKALNSLETRFRQSLDRFGYDMDGFKPWRWMAFDDYAEWQAQWKVLCSALTDLRLDIIVHYDEIVAENRAYFQGVARRAWQNIRAQITTGAVAQIGGRVYANYEDFEERIVTTALAKLPSVEFLHTGIFADYKTGYLVTPPEVLSYYSQLNAAQYQESAAEAQARQEWLAARDQEMALDEKRMTQRARAEAVKQAELEHARQQLASIKSPVQEVMEQFRARIYEKVVKATAALSGNHGLPAKTATMLKGLGTLYQTLAAVTEDNELETALASLQNALDKIPAEGEGKYDIGAVAAALTGVMRLTEDAAHSAARASVQESRASVLEL